MVGNFSGPGRNLAPTSPENNAAWRRSGLCSNDHPLIQASRWLYIPVEETDVVPFIFLFFWGGCMAILDRIVTAHPCSDRYCPPHSQGGTNQISPRF